MNAGLSARDAHLARPALRRASSVCVFVVLTLGLAGCGDPDGGGGGGGGGYVAQQQVTQARVARTQ